MPEHVHLLISEAGKKTPSKILQVLKQKVARALLKNRRRSGGWAVVASIRGEYRGRGAFLAETIL